MSKHKPQGCVTKFDEVETWQKLTELGKPLGKPSRVIDSKCLGKTLRLPCSTR